MNWRNIYRLGIKELISLSRDPILLGFIVYAFTVAIYVAGMSVPETLHKVPIAIVDEDHSTLSRRIIDAFYPPYFAKPALVTLDQLDERMNAGTDSFSLVIPSRFQQEIVAGKQPEIQLNIDATRISQALTGNEHIQQIIRHEVAAFTQKGSVKKSAQTIDFPFRILFNPELKKSWFSGLMELIDNITLLSIVLTGAALIREREHGTIEHLLVMPVTPLEIMVSKIWSTQLVVLVTSLISLLLVIRLFIGMPIQGSLLLFIAGVLLVLFAMTSLGLFISTYLRSMTQFALLIILIILPMLILSGTLTPRESMPAYIQKLMLLAPNTHFVTLSQAIIYRGAHFRSIWPQFLALAGIGSVLFALSLLRFRKALSQS